MLDVGSGPGAACLPLLPRTTELTAVDVDERMLELLAERTSARGLTARCVTGRWPDVAPEVPASDVVTCHHVLYNVPDLEPFLLALTDHARRQVIVEIAALHPLTSLNEMWLRFHDLRRPDRPTADDVLSILSRHGRTGRASALAQARGADYSSFAELTDVTRRRLCLPQQRAQDVSDALIEAGVDPEHPQDLGSSGRDVMTIWWDGRAPN